MKVYSVHQKLMGTAFSLGVVAQEEAIAQQWLAEGVQEIQRIEALLSEFLPDSDTSRMNGLAGKEKVTISTETAQLIARCSHISVLTGGDFDMTVKPLKKLYQFKNENFEMPLPATIQATLQSVGYQKIRLEGNKVSFAHPNVAISFAAVGKGYASDCVKRLWIAKGIQAGYINASGDLNSFGNKPDGKPWNVAIANPDKQDEILCYVNLQESSVATSGDYAQYFMHKGVRYSHNLNPHTGLPLTGIKSVSVFSPSAELSDALATAVYVKGVQRGLEFANQLPKTHAIIIDELNRIHFSHQIQYEKVA